MEKNRPSTGLVGPYDLDDATINTTVTKKSAGNYALGKTAENGTFLVYYVGRSDDNLNSRLHAHAGKYTKFKYGYAASSKAAFDKECELYHDFAPPDNSIHPARPEGSNWKCPRCRTFG
jgi:hypothetical protein